MTVASVGYPNSIDPSINAEEWALMQPALGNHYWVENDQAGQVSVPGGAFTVRVATGRIGGHGVMDDITATEDIVLPEPGSGTVYYTIVARRVWQTTNATTLTYVTGTTTREIASGRNVTPGTIDDHPLALVAVTNGNSTPTISADLRAIGYGHGRYGAHDALVLDYMDKPGYVIRIDGTEWLRTIDGTWTRSGRPRVGELNDYNPQTSGVKNGHSKIWALTLPTKPFNRLLTIDAYFDVSVEQGAQWRARLVLGSPGDPDTPGGGLTLASEYMYTSAQGTQRQSVSMSATAQLPANDTRFVRLWVEKISGGSCEVIDENGRTIGMHWIEYTENDW